MMTKLTYLAYNVYFGFNRKSKFLPYEWDPRKNELRYTEDKLTIWIWRTGAISIFFATIYITLRLTYEFFYPKETFTVSLIVVYMMGVVGLSLAVIFNITIFLRENEMGVVATTGINIDLRFRKKFKWMRKVRPPLFDFIGFGMLWLLPGVFFISLIGSAFAVFAKVGPARHFLREWLPIWLAPHFLVVGVFWIGSFIIITYFLNIICFYCLLGVTYIQMSIFWTGHFAVYCPKYLTKVMKDPNLTPDEKLAEEKKVLDAVRSSYMELQMLSDIINEHTFLISPGFFAVALFEGLLVNFCTLGLYNIISMPFYAIFPVIMFGLIGLDTAFIPQGAKLHILSNEFIANWKRFNDDKNIRKWLYSCRPICLRIGQFFFIAKSTTFSFFAILFEYTINLLLTYQI